MTYISITIGPNESHQHALYIPVFAHDADPESGPLSQQERCRHLYLHIQLWMKSGLESTCVGACCCAEEETFPLPQSSICSITNLQHPKMDKPATGSQEHQ